MHVWPVYFNKNGPLQHSSHTCSFSETTDWWQTGVQWLDGSWLTQAKVDVSIHVYIHVYVDTCKPKMVKCLAGTMRDGQFLKTGHLFFWLPSATLVRLFRSQKSDSITRLALPWNHLACTCIAYMARWLHLCTREQTWQLRYTDILYLCKWNEMCCLWYELTLQY